MSGRFRFACASCGHGRRRVYWSDDKRERLLARCLDCGANFNGSGQWLPLEWAQNSARGLSIEVDPCASHRHGHGKCNHVNQGELGL